jgi:hypothetical protein
MKQKLNTSKWSLRFLWTPLLLVFLVGIAASFSPLAKTPVAFADDDHDGYPTPADYDDSDGSIHPGAIDICNSKDENYDVWVDETCRVYYEDFDRDGFGARDLYFISYIPPPPGLPLYYIDRRLQ